MGGVHTFKATRVALPDIKKYPFIMLSETMPHPFHGGTWFVGGNSVVCRW